MSVEIWRSVKGFENRYEISNFGRIKSLKYRSNMEPRIMKTTKNYSGYHVVSLGKQRIQKRLHVLVFEAFVGLRPIGKHACHNDNNKDNNLLSNLRWDTPKNNIKDRRTYAEINNPNSKLTVEDIIEIRKMVKEIYFRGFYKILANVYGVHSRMISYVAKGIYWKNIKEPPFAV